MPSHPNRTSPPSRTWSPRPTPQRAGATAALLAASGVAVALATVLLGQKYFGWGSESVKLLLGLKKGQQPPSTIIDSGVDIVTKENVEAYVAEWNKLAAGQ